MLALAGRADEEEEPSAEAGGETTPNGLCATSDFLKLENADSARCPVECATLERSKEPEPAFRACPLYVSDEGEASVESERPGCFGCG